MTRSWSKGIEQQRRSVHVNIFGYKGYCIILHRMPSPEELLFPASLDHDGISNTVYHIVNHYIFNKGS